MYQALDNQVDTFTRFDLGHEYNNEHNIFLFLSFHGSQSRSRPPTQRVLRRIGLSDSNRSRAIRAKRYIERSKNSEKITTNLKKM